MKRILILLLTFGVFLGVSGFVLGAIDQGVNATVNENISILITPSVVEFGAIIPGSSNVCANNGPISFDATGSNTNVTINVTSVTSIPFGNGLKFDGTNPVGQVFNQNCDVVSEVCTYTPVNTTPTLNVPVGTPIGPKIG